MLSYQHAYHAGCRADVHKHAVLTMLLQQLTRADTPLAYMETHAGRGMYRLDAPEALKTGEAQDGIIAMEARLDAAHPYCQLLRHIRQQAGAMAYPGSPAIAQRLLLPTDSMHLMELHPQENAALRVQMKGSGAHIYKRDGYEAVLALAPPSGSSGLVLIDPSYEVKSEYMQAADFVLELHAKWPETTILLWYPLLAAENHLPMLDKLQSAHLPACWQQQVRWQPLHPRAMQGSGLFAVNLPDNMREALDTIASWFPEG